MPEQTNAPREIPTYERHKPSIQRLIANIAALDGKITEETLPSKEDEPAQTVRFHNKVTPTREGTDWYGFGWTREDERLLNVVEREKTMTRQAYVRYHTGHDHPEWVQGGSDIRIIKKSASDTIIVVINIGTVVGMENAWRSVMQGVDFPVNVSDQSYHSFTIEPHKEE